MIRDKARVSLVLNARQVTLTLEEAYELRDFLVELLGPVQPLSPHIAIAPLGGIPRVSSEEL